MSRYTTEVRYICEHYANVEHSTLAPDVFNVIDKSRKQIFDFPYPIFDENYREPLEKKILAHYYVREIGLETVGLWKLFLRNKMNEIMPYYNQLYLSEKIKFNPLINEDNTTTHEREYGRTQDTTDNITVKVGEDTSTDSNKTEQQNGVNVRNSDNLEDTIHGHVVNTSDSGTKTNDGNMSENYLNNKGTTDSKVTTNENLDSEITGENGTKSSNDHHTQYDAGTMSYKDSSDNVHTKSYNGYTELDTYGKTENDNGRETKDYSGTEEQTYKPGAETKETTVLSHSVLTTHSDTPQGALDNFLAGKYMSDVTKQKYDADGTGDVVKKEYVQGEDTTRTTYGVNGAPRQDTVTHDNTIEQGGQDTKTINGSIVDSDSVNDKKDMFETNNDISNETENKTVEKDGSQNGNNLEQSTFQETDSGIKTGGTDDNTITANTSNTVNSGIDTNVKGLNETTAESNSGNTGFHEDVNHTSDSVTNDVGNLNINDTESYLTHLIGKSGSMTYSAMLNEFRSTFLNIDMMVIGELEELFMQIW